MTTKLDQAYGIIPIFDRDAESLFLLVQKGEGPGSFWAFPKGHKEAGEDDIDAALRELREETGIVLDRSALLPDVVSERYSFERGGVTYDKTVDYRIGRVSSMDIVIDEEEITDYAWLTYDRALDKITFPESKELLRKAQEMATKGW